MADARKVAAATEHVESTKLHEELTELRDTMNQIQQELAALREQLAAAGFSAAPKAPVEPSFGMSEGTREEIERNGKSVDPFTGRTLTRDDLKNSK